MVHARAAELDTDADAVQRQVTGVVALKLFDGACSVGDVKRRAVAQDDRAREGQALN